MTGLVAGVDVGASGSRLRVVVPGAASRDARVEIGAVVSGGEPGVARLAGALTRALESLLAPDEVLEVVTVGAAALLALGAAADVLPPTLTKHLGVGRVVLASDAITSYLGAMTRPERATMSDAVPAGAVVAAGTGAIAIGYSEATGWRRVDGWGYLLGDEGSGAWIGMAGVHAAMRAHDGRRGGSPELLRRLLATYGTADGLPSVVYPAPDRAARVAAFAPQVAEAAAAGDGIARAIWRDAGRLLAEAAAAALPAGGEHTVSWAGGLFAAGELLLAPFRETVTRLRPEARPRAPFGGSLDGAVALAMLAGVAATSPVPAPWAREYAF